jgi:hypothetical protein
VFELGDLSSIPVKALPQFGKQLQGQGLSLLEARWPDKRTGKPDQQLVLKNHDFAMPVEIRAVENIGNSPIELVEIELK